MLYILSGIRYVLSPDNFEAFMRPRPVPVSALFFWSFGLWAAAYVGAPMLLERVSSGAGIRLLVALLPLPFFLTWLGTAIRAVRTMDEMERRIQLEALAVAFPLSLILVMTLGLLEVTTLDKVAPWGFRRMWCLFVLFYCVGLELARRRYR